MVINQILLNPSSIARLLGAVAFLLVLASIVCDLIAYLILAETFRAYWFVKLFNLDLERNIPTFFSMLLLLFAALLLAVIIVLKRNQKASQISHWTILSLGFLFMAADEAFSFHETLSKSIREMFGNGNLGIFYFAWVIPGIIIVIALIPLFFRFLLLLPAKTRLTFLIAFTLYIAGAIGFEIIGGRHDELYGRKNWTYRMLATIEESLEMAGVIIFIWGLLVYIANNYKEIRLGFEGVRTKAIDDS